MSRKILIFPFISHNPEHNHEYTYLGGDIVFGEGHPTIPFPDKALVYNVHVHVLVSSCVMHFIIIVKT